MTKLVRNVFAAGEWWGPAHGRDVPSPEAALEITNPACWEGGEVPDFVVEATGSSTEPPAGTPLTADQLAEIERLDQLPDPGNPPPAPDLSWLTDPGPTDLVEHELPPVPAVEENVESERSIQLRLLAAVADDKDALLAFADEHGIEVNRRLGVENLRADIVAHLEA